MRILIANAHLNGRSGGETYVLDLALQLFRNGHTPIVFTREVGPIFYELKRASIPTITDFAAIGSPPDIIIGCTQEETVLALLKFPKTPAVFICHARQSWLALAPKFSRIYRYIAVDENCADGMLNEQGIPKAKMIVLLNSVNLEKFKPRQTLPQRPKRALIFSNYAKHNNYIPLVQKACEMHGISLDIMGQGVGNMSVTPENILPSYDLVFGKARCALEAMAVGCAVILCDTSGLGAMVKFSEVEKLRLANFGWRLLQTPVTIENIAHQITQYDSADAKKVSEFIRSSAGLEQMVATFETLLSEVIAEHKIQPHISIEQEFLELSNYVEAMGLPSSYMQLYFANENLRNEVSIQSATIQNLKNLEEKNKNFTLELAHKDWTIKELDQCLQNITNSRSWRLTASLRKIKKLFIA